MAVYPDNKSKSCLRRFKEAVELKSSGRISDLFAKEARLVDSVSRHNSELIGCTQIGRRFEMFAAGKEGLILDFDKVEKIDNDVYYVAGAFRWFYKDGSKGARAAVFSVSLNPEGEIAEQCFWPPKEMPELH